MKPVHASVVVERPATEVFDFVSDVRNNPLWQGGMRSCTWTSPEPHGAGATYDQVAHFLGKDVVSGFRVADHQPPHQVRFESVSGPFPIIETRVVTPSGPRASRVEATVGGDARGFFRVAAPLLRLLVRRSVSRDYRRLARLLSSPPPAP